MTQFTLKKLALLIGDIILLYTALFMTVIIRYQSSLSYELWMKHVVPFSILFIIWIVVFFINNLYTIHAVKNDFKFYGYLIQNLIINLLIGFTFFYLAPRSLTSLTPFRVLLVLILIFTILFLFWRKFFYHITSSKKRTNRILFIGMNKEAFDLCEDMKKHPQFGFTPAVIIDPTITDLPESFHDIKLVKEITGITDVVKANNIQTIVTVGNTRANAEVSRYLFETLSMGLSYHTFTDLYEKLTGKIPIATIEESWFLENLLKGDKKWFELGKRFVDIVAVLIFGSLALLVTPFIICAIKVSSPGPLLFKQERTGKGGKSFMAMKFRSMIVNAESHGPQWATKNDSRVTNVGKFLRKTRLDEIPQFLNILKGDMTFVGPRPERPEFVALLTEKIPFYKERLLIKPGLSGWAQINFKYGDSVDDAMTKLQYDLFYIKNKSFALDLSIVLKTISTVLNASLGQ